AATRPFVALRQSTKGRGHRVAPASSCREVSFLAPRCSQAEPRLWLLRSGPSRVWNRYQEMLKTGQEAGNPRGKPDDVLSTHLPMSPGGRPHGVYIQGLVAHVEVANPVPQNVGDDGIDTLEQILCLGKLGPVIQRHGRGCCQPYDGR